MVKTRATRFQHSTMKRKSLRKTNIVVTFMSKPMNLEQIEYFVYTNKNNAKQNIQKTQAQPYYLFYSIHFVKEACSS